MDFDKSVTLQLGHSPDPDDAFMFYAMSEEKVDLRGYNFNHQLVDIQTLNERCLKNDIDISAVSFHTLAFIKDQYEVMSCGASMGDGYGPVLIQKKSDAKNTLSVSEILNKKIAIPGELTSAFLALQIYLFEQNKNLSNVPFEKSLLNYIVVPFDEIFNSIESGEADLGVIIHEGQLTYNDLGFEAIVDLGKWWKEETKTPLPLGCNVINKDIPEKNRIEISEIIKESIEFALDNSHKKDALLASMKYSRDLDFETNDEFVNMYVNDYTIDLGEVGRKGVDLFYKKAEDYDLLKLPEKFSNL